MTDIDAGIGCQDADFSVAFRIKWRAILVTIVVVAPVFLSIVTAVMALSVAVVLIVILVIAAIMDLDRDAVLNGRQTVNAA